VLQGDPALDLGTIGASAYDLIVIDYSRDGSEAGEFSAERSRTSNTARRRKIVLAYMSIGEAEVVRFYFDYAWVTPILMRSLTDR